MGHPRGATVTPLRLASQAPTHTVTRHRHHEATLSDGPAGGADTGARRERPAAKGRPFPSQIPDFGKIPRMHRGEAHGLRRLELVRKGGRPGGGSGIGDWGSPRPDSDLAASRSGGCRRGARAPAGGLRPPIASCRARTARASTRARSNSAASGDTTGADGPTLCAGTSTRPGTRTGGLSGCAVGRPACGSYPHRNPL
jgi:hypothetical protein